MASSLIESIQGILRPEMNQAIATRLGEPPEKVKDGLSTAMSAILAGLEKRSEDTDFLSQVVILVGEASGHDILGHLQELAANGPSGSSAELVKRFVWLEFVGEQNQVAGVVAQKSGVSTESAGELLRTAVPLILGFFAKMASSGNLNLSSLGSILQVEAPNFQRYLPVDAVPIATQSNDAAEAARMGGPGKWLMLLGALGAGLVGWLVYSAVNMPK
jgi:hypothetical protein